MRADAPIYIPTFGKLNDGYSKEATQEESLNTHVSDDNNSKPTQKQNRRRRRLPRSRQRGQTNNNRNSQSETVLSVSTDQNKKGNEAKSKDTHQLNRNERKQSNKKSLNQKKKNEKRNEKCSDKNLNIIKDDKYGSNQTHKNFQGMKKHKKRGRRNKRKVVYCKEKRQDPFFNEKEDVKEIDDGKIYIEQFPVLTAKSLDCQQTFKNNDIDDPSGQEDNKIWSKVAYTAHVKDEMEQNEKRVQEKQEQNAKDHNYQRLYTLVEKQNEIIRDKVGEDEANIVMIKEKEKCEDKQDCDDKAEDIMESHEQSLRFQRKLDFQKLKKRWWNNLQQQKQDWEQTTDSEALSSSSSSIQSSSCSYSDELSSICSLSSDTDEVSKKYWDEPLPIHCAIWNNDEMALEKLLSSENNNDAMNVQQNIHSFVKVPQKFLLSKNDYYGNKRMSLLQYVIYLDRPVLLRIILANRKKQAVFDMLTDYTSSNDDNDCLSLTPLMLACQKGFNECVKTLLRFVGPKQILQKIKGSNIIEIPGNTAMHYACENGRMYTIELLLNGCSKNTNQLRSILCAKNNKDQTPMHLAASNGHTSTITFLLQSFPLISSKVLQIPDKQGKTPFLAAVAADNDKSTDTMMHLLMWKNKNYHYLKKDNSLGHEHTNNLPCPLSLAVSICSLEKVRLLLDFDQDPFDLDGALVHIVQKYDSISSDVIMELVQILIEAGANPYNITHDGTSTLLCVLQDGQVDLMEFIIQKFHEIRKNQDIYKHIPKPFLVRTSNFQTQLQQEEEKTQQNVRECVIKALCSYCYHESNKFQQQMHCCRILLQRPSFEFKEIHYDHLIDRLINMSSTASNHDHNQPLFPMKFRLEASYTHYDIKCMKSKSATSISPYIDRPQKNHWTSEMMRLSWILEGRLNCNNTSCKWLRDRVDEVDASITTNFRAEDDICYLIIEGCRYPVHRSLISKKSMKLQAAIRFADNQQQEQNSSQISIVEVPVDLSLPMAKLFISHCYHGSMIFSSQSLSCDLLLELSIIAEEYICPSLMQECEMRLLSQRPHSTCFCWNCCNHVSSYSESENVAKDSQKEVSFQCTYHVAGSSKLLTAQTALDVYSVAQQLALLNKQNGQYNIIVVNNNRRKLRVNGNSLVPICNSINPFEAVQTAAMKTVLMCFKNVLKSDSFQSNLHNSMIVSEKNECQTVSSVKQYESEYAISLLDTCVSSLASSPLNQILYKC